MSYRRPSAFIGGQNSVELPPMFLSEAFHPRGHLGKLVEHICGLHRIGLHVEQRQLDLVLLDTSRPRRRCPPSRDAIGVRNMQLPPAIAADDALETRAGRERVVLMRIRRAARCRESGPRHPFRRSDAPAAPRLPASQTSAERSIEQNVCFDTVPGFDLPRVPHDASTAGPAIEARSFRLPIRSLAGMVAVGVPRAVVGRHHDERVVLDARFSSAFMISPTDQSISIITSP